LCNCLSQRLIKVDCRTLARFSFLRRQRIGLERLTLGILAAAESLNGSQLHRSIEGLSVSAWGALEVLKRALCARGSRADTPHISLENRLRVRESDVNRSTDDFCRIEDPAEPHVLQLTILDVDAYRSLS